MRKTMWSVEIENKLWDDDLFNGTYDECVEYCQRLGYTINGIEARLAKILVENGVVIETLELMEEL